MRVALCAGLFCLIPLVCAADAGKTHEFKRGKLPKVVKAKAGDIIVVVEDVKPADVESLKAISNNRDLNVKGQTVGGQVRIVIRANRKGKARVGWQYETAAGKVGGHKGLDVEFE